MRKLELVGLLAGTCAILPSGALAQTVEAPGSSPLAGAGAQSSGQERLPDAGQRSPATAESGDIVVVAQRREQRLRDVPASVAAIGAGQLEATTSQRVQDVANYVPNVAINANSSLGATLTIRGVGSSSRNIGFDSRAGVYIDGVYLGQSPALDQDLLGLARVEVLRGPQGTLFGKNNDAGAMNLITERPGKTFGGEAFARIGNLDLRQFAARVYGPLSDVVSLSLAASDINRNGYIRNLSDGRDMPTRNSTSLRSQINIDGGGPLTVYLAADALFARERPNNGDPLTNALGTRLNTDAPGENVTNYTAGRIANDRKNIWGISGEVAYALANGGMLKSITAYRETDFTTSFDGERTLPDLLYVTYADKYRQTSEELQFISPASGRLRYLAGLYFYHQDSDTNRDALGGAQGAALGVAPGRGTVSSGSLLTQNVAGYGNVSYDIVPQLEASFGARYSWEKKSVDWAIHGRAAPAFGIATGTIDASRVDRDFSPTATLTYRLTPRVNIYGRFSTGYKSGGYNLDFVAASVFPSGVEFRKETVDNYEVGLKGAFLDGAATLNLSGFTASYDNYQLNSFRNLGGGRSAIAISNAGSVRTSGIEAEGTFRASKALAFQGGIGVLDAKFEDYPGGGAGGVNLAGKRLPRASKFQGTIGANFRQGLGSGLSLLASTQYSYRSSYYVEENNFATQQVGGTTIAWGRVPGYGLLDGRVGLAARSGWEIAVWARNVTNRNYVNSYSREFLGTLIEYRGEPRTIGGEVRFKF